MIEITQAVNQHTAIIKVVEDEEDYTLFKEWLARHKGKALAADTETTGLDIYSDSFEVRTVQVGFGLEAWVLPTCVVSEWEWLTECFLIFHNAAYDVLAIRQSLGINLDWDKIQDTKILAHLVDPRPVKDGGHGLSLKDLTACYISEELAKDVKGSMAKMARANKLKVGEVFEKISVWDETYLLYAGMDVVLTGALQRRLYKFLRQGYSEIIDERGVTHRLPTSDYKLVAREHQIARICAEMEHGGFLLDVEYSEKLSKEYQEQQEAWEALAYVEFGVESVNSNAELAEVFQECGYRLNELTASGKLKMDSNVLKRLSSEGCKLADYVIAAKGYKKHKKTWVDTFLATRDHEDRCHAHIQPLQARTGRMSITGIPAQTLPSGDATMRLCFIAEPGFKVASCDYQAQELRVLAALSGDRNMIQAFKEDADLHQMTADASGVDRKVGKTVNFAYVYGSGPKNIAETCDITIAKAKEVIAGFERTYPGVKKLADHLQIQARGAGFVKTPYGRILPVDKERPYASLNYMVQSTSRDVTCDALIKLDEAGFTPYLRLPIHDEIVAVVPEDVAEPAAEKIARLMAKDMKAPTGDVVHIGTDADVYGDSWGDGYL